MLFGASIMLGYWVYYLRVRAMRCGLGKEGYVSFTPLVAPICVFIGATIYPLFEPLQWLVWALLGDSNCWYYRGDWLAVARKGSAKP